MEQARPIAKTSTPSRSGQPRRGSSARLRQLARQHQRSQHRCLARPHGRTHLLQPRSPEAWKMTAARQQVEEGCARKPLLRPRAP
eukprot:13535433-Alexandrium_andersonii.AAC.1